MLLDLAYRLLRDRPRQQARVDQRVGEVRLVRRLLHLGDELAPLRARVVDHLAPGGPLAHVALGLAAAVDVDPEPAGVEDLALVEIADVSILIR